MVERGIVIIGGGPAGATAAGLLAAAGQAVTVCEQKAFPRAKVCGEFVAPAARPVLARLGVLEAFDRLAGPAIRRLAVYLPGAAPVTAAFPADAAGQFPRPLRREALDLMLLRRAGELGARVLQPCHVSEITGSADTGFIVATGAGPLRARAVVLAHGRAPQASVHLTDGSRPSAGPASPNDFLAFKAYFTGAVLADQTLALATAPGVYAGLVRTSATRELPVAYTLAFVARRRLVTRLGPGADRLLGHLLGHHRTFARVLAAARRATPWLAAGPLCPGPRETYLDGRFFVGNAAGEVHPLVGEGMTLALQSAALLADTIQDSGLGDLEAVAGTYSPAWQALFLPRYRAAQLFATLLTHPLLADPAAAVLEAFPDLLAPCIRAST